MRAMRSDRPLNFDSSPASSSSPSPVPWNPGFSPGDGPNDVRRCGMGCSKKRRCTWALCRDVSWARRSAAASASSSESSLLSLPSSCSTRHGTQKDSSWNAWRCRNVFECQLANTKLSMPTTTKVIDIFQNTTDQERNGGDEMNTWKQTCLFQS